MELKNDNEEINVSVESFLDTIEKTINNELKFVKSNDWTKKATIKERNDLHDLQFLLTDRSVKHANKLYSLSVQAGNDDSKKVKDMLKLLLTFYKLYEERYDYYTNKQDYNKILDDVETEKINIKAEIEFQSDLVKNLTSFKETVRKIDINGESTKNQIQVFNDIPIPFLMKKAVINRYSSIGEKYEQKLKDK